MLSHSEKSGGDKLKLIEVGRGIAALAVVRFHANASSRHIGGPFYSGLDVFEHGVDFFFVISGVIIYVAHADRPRGGAGTREYLRRRALRIFPTLWLIVAGWALLRSVAGRVPDAARMSFADHTSSPAFFGTLALVLLFAVVVYSLRAEEKVRAPLAWMVRPMRFISFMRR